MDELVHCVGCFDDGCGCVGGQWMSWCTVLDVLMMDVDVLVDNG